MLGLVSLAGGRLDQAVVLAASMLLLQFAIGAANDWFDADLDAATKPSKPIAAGLVSRATAWRVAFVAGTAGLALAGLAPGSPQPQTLVLALVILSVGLAYDALLKPTPLSWLPFALAFPLLLLYAWTSVPFYPAAGLLVPAVAFVAGPALQLANGLVDLEGDRAAGVRSLPSLLGRPLSVVALAALQLLIYLVVWLTLRAFNWLPPALTALFVLATALSLGSVALSAARSPAVREWGWRGQAVGLALLAIGWTLIRVPDEFPGG